MAYAFDLEVLVREVTVKGSKCIQLQKIGERKEHQFKFEVISSCLRGADDDIVDVVNDRAYGMVTAAQRHNSVSCSGSVRGQ